MKAMKKSLMMRGMVLLHYGITVLLFVSCWWLLVAVLQAYRSWSSIWSGEYFGIRVLCGIAADA